MSKLWSSVSAACACALVLAACQVESVDPGPGLQESTEGALAVDPAQVPVVGSCGEGEFIRQGPGGAWECASLASGGAVTEVVAGEGLLSSGPPSSMSLAVDFGQVARAQHGHDWSAIAGKPDAATAGAACAAGQHATGVDVTAGTVTCDADDDTVGSLACDEQQVAKMVAGEWACADDFSVPPSQWLGGAGGAIHYSAGPVGIGTATPSSPLVVAGAESPLVRIGEGATGPTGALTVAAPADGAGIAVGVSGAASSGLVISRDSADTGDLLRIQKSEPPAEPQSLLVVDKNGNVGIGAPSPVANLFIYRWASPVAMKIADGFYGSVFDLMVDFHGTLLSQQATSGDDTYNRSKAMRFAVGTPPQERMRITADGDVGIGTTEPAAMLHVSGDLAIGGEAMKPGGGSWTASSDRRLKKNVKPLAGALERLLALHGVTYEWVDPARQGNFAGTQIGMIAQEVEQVFPAWVGADRSGYRTLTYRGFEALTVEAMRELSAENERLARANDELSRRLAALEARQGVTRGLGPGAGGLLGAILAPCTLVVGAWAWGRRRRPSRGG